MLGGPGVATLVTMIRQVDLSWLLSRRVSWPLAVSPTMCLSLLFGSTHTTNKQLRPTRARTGQDDVYPRGGPQVATLS